MASFQRGLRPSLLRIPLKRSNPLYRPSPHARSLSSPAEYAYAGLIAGPTAVLDTLHAVGLPWFATIPVAAFLIRGISGYFVTEWQRGHALRQLALVPLAEATHVNRINDSRMRSDIIATTSWQTAIPQIGRILSYRRTLASLSRKYGLPPGFQWAGLAINMPILLSFGEALRLKAGANQGLLSFVLAPLDWLANATRYCYNSVVHFVARRDTHEMTDFPVTGKVEGMLPELSQYLDPSLHVGGIPGWCVDLALQDPTLLLPAMFGVSWILNTGLSVSKTHNPGRNPKEKTEWWFSKLTTRDRFWMSVGLVVAVAGVRLPSGILLYLIASTWTGMGVRTLISRKYPQIPPIRACKIPMRYTARRDWHDV